ncbi:MAG TPA: PTS sugar transporter subunit IIB, partial [Clostridium sp.]|nr:PTS sugar transporter subunit IIB [Clostridium sp.]
APGSDVILLGPQVGYMKDSIVKKYPDIPVEVMNMKDYGMMKGEKIFNDMAEKYGW